MTLSPTCYLEYQFCISYEDLILGGHGGVKGAVGQGLQLQRLRGTAGDEGIGGEISGIDNKQVQLNMT